MSLFFVILCVCVFYVFTIVNGEIKYILSVLVSYRIDYLNFPTYLSFFFDISYTYL